MLPHARTTVEQICLTRRLQRVELFWCEIAGGENHAFRGRFSENQPKEFLTCLCVVVSEAV